MNRIIINNQTDLEDDHVCYLVLKVIKLGRISQISKKPSYCAASSYLLNGTEFMIYAKPNNKSYTFTIQIKHTI